MTTIRRESLYSLDPLFWIAAAFALGILTADHMAFDVNAALAVAVICSLISIVLSKYRHAWPLTFIAAFAVGACVYQLEQISISDGRIRVIYDTEQLSSHDTITLTGAVASGPEPAYQGAVIEVDVTRLVKKGIEIKATGRVRLFITADSHETVADLNSLDLKIGSVIQAVTSLDRDERFFNPGVRSRKKMLDDQGIDAAASVKSPLLIKKVADGGANPLNAVFGLRRAVIKDIRERFNTSTAGILIASTLGDKHFLDRRDSEIFRGGGTFHILVISGLHITIIGLIVIFFVRRLTGNRYVRFIAATSFLWAYALAVGAEPPVVRAAVMFTIFLFSQVIYRNASMLNSLGFCCLLLLAMRPSELFAPSFQLTFLSVSAIVLLAVPLISQIRGIGSWVPTAATPFPPKCPHVVRRLCETLYWNEAAWKMEMNRQVWSANLFKSPHFKWFGFDGFRRSAALILEGLIVSIAVQLFLLPLMVVYFHRFPVLGVLLNIWAGVMLAVESIVAFIAVLLDQLSDTAALPFVRVAELVNWLLTASQQFFIDGFASDLRIPVYSGTAWAIYVLYFIPLIVLAFALARWRPFDLKHASLRSDRIAASVAVVLIALFALVIVFHPFSETAPDGRLTVRFLDVGQGDATFITFPNGEKMLIDGGGRPNMNGDDDDEFQPDTPRIGEMVVSEFLWEQGISRIDHVVATHADSDHVQGLEDVVSNFSVGNLYIGTVSKTPSESDRLLRIADEKNITINKIAADDELSIAGAMIHVLWPPVDTATPLSDNDSSVVMKITYGQHSFLFTGDIEKYAEDQIAQKGEFLRADVVKVAHHGSRTSSTTNFIEASRPKFAVIPVGRRSIFGHPHAEVVERWKFFDANIMTTGRYGTITISTDGEDLIISTFLADQTALY